jgi:Ca-activated chloride channel family protein
MKFFSSIVVTLLFAFSLLFVSSSAVATSQQTPPRDKKQDDKKTQDKKGQKPEKPQGEEAEGDQAITLGTQLVTVPFNVTDKKNRYINELTKDDIEILEDNKEQQIFSFERQTDLPITIAMAIDISGSQQYTLGWERMAGQRFYRRVLRPKKDLGAVVSFEHESVLVQDLTSDVSRLLRALDEVRVPAESVTVRRGGTPPINNSGVGSTAMYDCIYSISGDLLGREAGRRVIILITDGDDNASSVKMKEAIERTWRNEIIVYCIGIGDPRFGVDSGDLKKIAAETGGRAFFPRSEDDLDKAFAQIDEDLRSQYIIAYQPSNSAKDGSFRTIQVRVKNNKDLNVRHRRGYFAPKSG